MAGGDKRRGLSKSCALLIVIAGIERYAFKGVASNLVTYLTDVVKMSNSRAAKTVNTWSGFTFMLPLFSAPFADSYWDRFFTILASSSLYFVGLVGLTFTAFAQSRSTTKTISLYLLYTSLCLVALGLGVLNPSLQAFGADQLDHDLDHDDNEPTSENKEVKSNHKSQFFQWWYFGVCAGSLLGVTVMAYIQDTFGWVLGFAIPTASMLLLIFLFLCGCGVYVYADPGVDLKPKPFQRILEIIKRKVWRRSKISLVNDHDLNAMELELQDQKPLCNCSTTEATTTKSLADDKSSKITGFSGLETAKLLLRLLPIWTMLLMFAVIFQQPATFFTKQGMTMKRNIGPNFKIPPATLQSTITLSIILLMPLYDKVLIPIAKKVLKNEKGISVMERMGIGMFLSIIAIVIAALVETKRLKVSKKMKTSPNSDPLSIFWLLPQYVLLGISDIFTVVGMQEFFYSEVPVKMRTMGFALYTSVFGVGSFVSAALISIIESFSSSRGGKHNWFADDMSEARLDSYYWLLALTSAISFLLYIVICKHFKSRSGDDHDDDDQCDENC
ncbi:Protein NRT1/ PTR FAMILY 5.8 [Cardamine amara subsp. amara]|uniref:Protein NRT1/ PTR FAMILY 5.8 n=1 Tax=Cardamine amara subsp. amara TaxID=228776 RepID=A0ABD1AGP4_CARAN